jgi:hypothetical protein
MLLGYLLGRKRGMRVGSRGAAFELDQFALTIVFRLQLTLLKHGGDLATCSQMLNINEVE